jgi:gas vesicle protein
MTNDNQQPEYHGAGVFTALLIGSLAGAVTMLLLAPHSGKDTRMQIEDKSIELRDQTTKIVTDTLAQIRSKAKKITLSGRKKFKELKHQGQELAVEQLDHASAVVKASKTAVKSF